MHVFSHNQQTISWYDARMNEPDASTATFDGEKKTAARRSSRPTMYWVRRLHLYSGLFLFPWVMLYGATALLFNHPEAFPDQVRRRLDAADVAGTGLDRLPSPSEAAAQLVAALNEASRGDGRTEPTYRLTAPESASYSRDFVAARVQGGGEEHSIVLDLATGAGTIGTRALPRGGRPPFATASLKPPGSLADQVKKGLPLALARKGLTVGDSRITFGPELSFFVEADGKTWKAGYNVATGSLTGRLADAGDGLGAREFLTRLHLAHGYQSSGWSRLVWAIFVDLMFAMMVFWGVSGLLMWWQLRSTRRFGAIVLALGAVIALLTAIGMHQALAGAR
jgi:hypothetical protein